MATGIEIFDTNGKLQFNGEMLTYALRASGTAYVENRKVGNTSPTSVMIPTTDTYTQSMVALSGGGGWAAAYAGRWGGNGQKIFATGNCPAGTAFEYFIFERSNTIPGANFGLEVRNANNEITFSTNQRAMRAMAMLNGVDQAVTYGGRKLAFCQATFAGHRIPGELVAQQVGGGTGGPRPGGPQMPDDPDPGGGGGTYQYSYRNDGKVYGGYCADGNQTIRTSAISWDDVTVGPSDSSVQPPAVVWPLSMFIIDVTSFPVGRTFF